MKTEISRFCETLLQSINAMPPALAKAAECIEKTNDQGMLEAPLASLNQVRAHLRSLVEKLGSQQAYLLIFGPLKSGKSTLMNAISGSYVSEVTSLPGYPCLVYVSNAQEPHFSVTRYNGRESVFADGTVLKDVIADSHVALAQQIRAVEKRGDEFDPRNHFTEAIRRIDVKLPVPSLAESSTVLVDTPGLYSRMNFGYDVLTREFRDSAACAVFVVKTDNLFLEQVFAEFNQLLDLFSRIFLVINVDSSKRDLHADGSLQPSVESRHPEQVIEAFKTLSMAGPLRRAYEEKRVRIHAVDLMNAASACLRPADGQNGDGSTQTAAPNGFQEFMRDLTEYLNSSDYTVEFIRDSLRQGATLCEETRAISEGSELVRVREKQAELDNEMQGLDAKIAAIDRLLRVDWEAAFANARTENANRSVQTASSRATTLTVELRKAVETWAGTSDSVRALEQRHLNPLFSEAARSLADDTRARLNVLTGNSLGGAEPAALVMTDLYALDFKLSDISIAALPKLDEKEAVDSYRMTIKEDDVPVRKSFGDWMLFRSAPTVRRRLLGDDLSVELEPEIKEKRLGEAAKEAFFQMIDDAVRERFPSLPGKFAERLLNGYVAKFREEIVTALREQRAQLELERAERQAPFDANTQVLAAMEELNEQASRVSAEIAHLAEKENALINPDDQSAVPVELETAAALPEVPEGTNGSAPQEEGVPAQRAWEPSPA